MDLRPRLSQAELFLPVLGITPIVVIEGVHSFTKTQIYDTSIYTLYQIPELMIFSLKSMNNIRFVKTLLN